MSTNPVEDRFRAVGATLKEEFRIDRVVAEGGFGLVYQATHVGLDRPVAVKVLKTPAEYNETARRAFVERFKQEARTVLRVKHPAVVQVLDFGASTFPNGEEAAWTAMEWVEGTTLDDELRARRKQGGQHPADVLALLRPVLEAVAVAHDEGIAHRDLKPANIMVVRGKRTVSVRLLDFGIAKMMEPGEEAGSGRTRTSSQMVACSPRYAAPEQLSSARTGPWSDVHALAMIVTEMLTDRLAYGAKDATGLFAEALSPVRPTPAKRAVDVGAWEPVLAKATAVRPDDRYANAGELLAALVAALPGATHPKAPLGDAALSTTAPFGAPSAPKNVTSPEALAATAASVPDMRPPITEAPDEEGDEDPPAPTPGGPVGAGAWGPKPPVAPASPFLAGTQPLPAPGGTLPLGAAPSAPAAPTGNTTLRGMSTDTPPSPPPAPAPRRSPMPIVAAVAVAAVLASLGFAFTRSAPPPVTPPVARPAARPAPVAPPPAALAAALAAPAPVAPPLAAPAVAAPAADDAGTPAVAPAGDERSERRRSRRSRRTRSRSADYNVD